MLSGRGLILILLAVATWLAGCNAQMGDYVAASSISKGGFVRDADALRRLDGREVKLWGYVDQGNLYGDEGARLGQLQAARADALALRPAEARRPQAVAWRVDDAHFRRAAAESYAELSGPTPYEYSCQRWQKQPELFLHDPFHNTLGLYA